jgi:hypothetical protein
MSLHKQHGSVARLASLIAKKLRRPLMQLNIARPGKEIKGIFQASHKQHGSVAQPG